MPSTVIQTLSSSGQYKKRLLQKYNKEQEDIVRNRETLSPCLSNEALSLNNSFEISKPTFDTKVCFS